MRIFFRFLIAVFCGGVGTSRAVDKVTATVAVTNAAGTTNGQTISINGDVRTWTNVVFVSSAQILTNSTAAGSKTNLYQEVALNPFSGVSELDAGSTNIQLIGNSGLALTVTLSAGWGTVSYSTQAVTAMLTVRVPTSGETAAQQTNINSGLMAAIRASSDTNQFYESDYQVANLAGLTNNQTFSGIKKLTNAANVYQGIVSNAPAISGNVGKVGSNGGLTNGVYWNPTNSNPIFTNAVNYGNPLSSPGTGTAEQFGAGASATANGALAVGRNAIAAGVSSAALGSGAEADGVASIAIGNLALAQNANDMAFGISATASGTNSIAIGRNSIVANGQTNSVAIGFGSATTSANQIMLGGSGINTAVQNDLNAGGTFTVGGSISNSTFTGTNVWKGDISYPRYALSSLGNGINQDIVVGTNVFVEVSGPSGAFSIEGIAGGRDGKLVYIWNGTGQNMTIAVEGGATGNDPTAANRIISGTGADRATTGNGSATLIYSGSASRWILINLDL
jgi:trimeric autotransporter adhesin